MTFFLLANTHRTMMGLTHQQLAQKMEWDKAHLSRILHCKKPSPKKEKVLRRIAASLDIPWHDLLFEALADRVLFNLSETTLAGNMTPNDRATVQEEIVKVLRKYVVIL